MVSLQQPGVPQAGRHTHPLAHTWFWNLHIGSQAVASNSTARAQISCSYQNCCSHSLHPEPVTDCAAAPTAIIRVRPAFAGEGRYFVRVPEGTNRNRFAYDGGNLKETITLGKR